MNTLAIGGAPVDTHAGQSGIQEWTRLLARRDELALYRALVKAGGGRQLGKSQTARIQVAGTGRRVRAPDGPVREYPRCRLRHPAYRLHQLVRMDAGPSRSLLPLDHRAPVRSERTCAAYAWSTARQWTCRRSIARSFCWRAHRITSRQPNRCGHWPIWYRLQSSIFRASWPTPAILGSSWGVPPSWSTGGRSPNACVRTPRRTTDCRSFAKARRTKIPMTGWSWGLRSPLVFRGPQPARRRILLTRRNTLLSFDCGR